MASRVKRHKRAEFKTRQKAPAPDSLPPPPRIAYNPKLRHDWSCNGVLISDHAVLRYLQNVYGLDAKAVRHEMVAGLRAEAIRLVGSGKIPIENNCRLVVRDGLVVTVVKPNFKGKGK